MVVPVIKLTFICCNMICCCNTIRSCNTICSLDILGTELSRKAEKTQQKEDHHHCLTDQKWKITLQSKVSTNYNKLPCHDLRLFFSVVSIYLSKVSVTGEHCFICSRTNPLVPMLWYCLALNQFIK